MGYRSTLAAGRTTRLAVETLERRTLLAADGLTSDLAQDMDNPPVTDMAETALYDTVENNLAMLRGSAKSGGVLNELDLSEVGADRPLKGSLSGIVTFEYDWDDEEFPITTVCDASGTMSHLGKVESHWTHNPPVVLPNYMNGQVVFTAANGDELRGEYGDDPDLIDGFSIYIVGGSGRFEDATGKIEVSLVVEGEWGDDGLPIQPWYCWWELTGTISYNHGEARRGADRPLKGSLSSIVTFEYDWSDPEFPVTTVSHGGGTMSHLGKVESHWTHNPPVVLPNYMNGQVVFTAANGDKLIGEYGGDPHLIEGFSVDIIGGTGRFEGATGTIEVLLVVEGEWGDDGWPIQPWYSWSELTGKISY